MSEYRRLRTENRGQKTEDRKQKTEDRKQRTENRGQKTEDRKQKHALSEPEFEEEKERDKFVLEFEYVLSFLFSFSNCQ